MKKHTKKTSVKAIYRKQRGGKAPPAIPEAGMRLNRYIALSGIASRRGADELIRQGLVRLNGEVVTEFGKKVFPGDEVMVNGEVITPRPYEYILLNKPEDTITTTRDERGRRTVLDLIEDEELKAQGLFPVGRLDRNTTGVLLLTNDGELAHRLMHPRYEVEKLYRVVTAEPVKPHELDKLRKGIPLKDGLARADEAFYVRPPNHHEIGILLHEGKNRQIRRMLEALGHRVVSLERVNYAGLTLEGVRRGKWRRLFPHEIKRIRKKVKLK